MHIRFKENWDPINPTPGAGLTGSTGFFFFQNRTLYVICVQMGGDRSDDAEIGAFSHGNPKKSLKFQI